MPKSVLLQLGTGDLYHGLPRVTAQVWAEGRSRPEQFVGSLPTATNLVELYREWQLLYQSLCERRPLRSITGTRHPLDEELEIDELGITNVSQVSFDEVCQQLQEALNTWLRSETFLPIEQQLRSQFTPQEEVWVIIETDDDFLRRLPWTRWDFFRDFPRAEMALSCSSYQFRDSPRRSSRNKARILAVLGNSQGIDLEGEAQFLEALADAKTQFLVNPSRQEFNQQLWDESGWDILFFAGHSRTEGESGRIYINDKPQHNSLTIEQFEAAIEGAVNRGLKLAIFNSCDGLGLATALSNLHIPQVIVMREPVPNRVAQEFFKHLMIAFAQQQLSLYLAVRQARRQLQGLENDFPGASWLPVLCQNPAVEPPTWQDWCSKPPETVRTGSVSRCLQTVLLISLAAIACISGIRYTGGLQPLELKAYDQLLRLRPPEPLDERILIVTITENDLHLPEQADRRGSLSDQALLKLLQTLTPLEPRAIGLDVYRDYPLNSAPTELVNLVEDQPNFFAICKVGDQAAGVPEIAPTLGLPSDRQGFSDVVLDSDNVLRRHLLFMDSTLGASCSSPYALSTQLAFYYLRSEGISPYYTSQGKLQLGEQTFQRLYKHTGGYQRTDTAGYQILLNYRLSQFYSTLAPTITLEDALSGRLKLEDVRDRIILIGVTAPSSKDFHLTPYGQEIAGVFIQAQMISQLISAAKDGRSQINVWNGWVEILWIGTWATLGGVFGWRCRSVVKRIGLEVSALGILVVLCFVGLMQSQWVPLVPTALVFLLTSNGVALVFARKDDKHPSKP